MGARGGRVAPLETHDVIVVGGGPAGASAAIRAARAGASVVLVDRDAAPRARPGETLHPGVEPILRSLGAWERVAARGYLRHVGTRVAWRAPARLVPFGEDDAGAWRGIHVARDELDAILLREAASAGARLLRPARATRPLLEGRRVVGVATDHGDLRARVIIDAAGARHWLARRLDLPIAPRSQPLMARYGYAHGDLDAWRDVPTCAARADGWLWLARVAPGRTAWTELHLRRIRADAPPPAELATLAPAGPARLADVTWRSVAACAGPGFFLVGDAAAVLDPAASHGVLRGLMSGMLAAERALAIVRHRHGGVDEAAIVADFRRWTASWFAHDAAHLATLYADFPSWRSAPSSLAAVG